MATAVYEELRQTALERGVEGRGTILLLREGMASWLSAQLQVSNLMPSPGVRTPEARDLRLPGLREELVSSLSRMVLPFVAGDET